MDTILHHLGWLKPYKSWDNHHPWWCRILSINSSNGHAPYSGNNNFWIFETDFLDDQRVSWKKILGGETFTATSKSLSRLHIFLQICGSMLQGEPGTTNWKENITTDFDIRKTLCLINIIQSYPINITSGYMSNWLRFIEQAHGKIRGRVQLWVNPRMIRCSRWFLEFWRVKTPVSQAQISMVIACSL